jgi:hypothetical protein
MLFISSECLDHAPKTINVTVAIDKMIYHTDSIFVEATLFFNHINPVGTKIRGEQTEGGLWDFVSIGSNRKIESEALLDFISEAINEYAAA